MKQIPEITEKRDLLRDGFLEGREYTIQQVLEILDKHFKEYGEIDGAFTKQEPLIRLRKEIKALQEKK